MARAGQFKPGGGRHGGKTKSRKKTAGGSKALVVVRETVAARPRKRAPARAQAPLHHPRRRRRHHGDGGVTLVKVGAAAVVLGNVAGRKDGVLGETVYNLAQKLPGAKTFGGAETLGLYAALLHRFTGFGGRFRPWIKAMGMVGIVGAGLKLGAAGTAFKWLGDPGGRDVFNMDQ